VKTVLVTGGNGFIGSVVVHKLLARGYAVRCLLRPTSETERISGLNYQVAEGDVRDAASVERAVWGCDGIIHLAGLSNWRDINSPLMESVVVTGTENVLAAASRTGNPRMVFVSTAAAINGSVAPVVFDETSACTLQLSRYNYSRVKRIAEDACRRAANAGLPVSIVNPAEVYGPHDTALNTAGNLIDFASSTPVLVCRGGTSVVHVDDVADGTILALERGAAGERYILGGENVSVVELARLTLDVLGRSTPVLRLPNPLVRASGRAAQRLKLPFPVDPNVIPYATMYWFMNNEKARTELGASFRDARDTLIPTLAWLAETKQL
jgi:dihydroflavonol-4-reductase